jgi:hypothetical protein
MYKRTAPVILGVCAVLACACAARPSSPKPQTANATTLTPLILEKEEGERRVVRGWPGHPKPGETFVLKVDPKNGADRNGPSASVRLGQRRAAGATVFIPANTWISVDNVGNDGISLVTVFSAPGFEDFMRAGSVCDGEKNVPLSSAEAFECRE